MKETILITGSTGLIARALVQKLSKNYNLRFLTRSKKRENDYEWDIEKQTIDEKVLEGVNHIIHLAGAGIVDKRWTQKRKKEIMSSRVDSARLLLQILQKKNIKIKSFISASAVGFYGTQTTGTIFTEDSPKGDDFLSEVVCQWEQIADRFTAEKVANRVVKLRTGVVLSAKGGVLQKMEKPIKQGFGAVLGSGNQYMPWIHIDDLCNLYEFCLQQEKAQDVFNAVAPQHITNKTFTKTLAKILGRPLFLPNVPSFVLQWVFGSAAVILLEGSRVSSIKLKEVGFRFKYAKLKTALNAIYNR